MVAGILFGLTTARELPSCQPASHLAEVTCFTELCPTVEKLFNL